MFPLEVLPRLRKGDAGRVVRAWFEGAMACYENAEAAWPPGNDEGIVRCNECASILARDERLRPERDLDPLTMVVEDVEAPQFEASGLLYAIQGPRAWLPSGFLTVPPA